MGDVVYLEVSGKIDIPIQNVIDGANNQEVETMIIIGNDKDGEFYFATSSAKKEKILYNLEKAKSYLFSP